MCGVSRLKLFAKEPAEHGIIQQRVSWFFYFLAGKILTTDGMAISAALE